MNKICLFILSACTVGLSHLEAQYSVPYSTSSLQGSTIITNYYDPNAGPDVGPGLPPTPLENRFTGPLNQFGNQASSIYPTGTYAPVGTSTVYPTGTYAPTTVVGTPTLQQQIPQPSAQYPPQQIQTARKGPVILNPIPSQNALPLPSHVEEPTYPYPGLLTKMNGRWLASEYLYDLPSDIGIVIEVIKPANKEIDVDTQALRNEITTQFLKSHFNPEALAVGDLPPLPFFHILIFAYPDENRSTASISGRLFEEVKLGRLDFNLPGTYQAITWEKSDLIITSSLQFNDQLIDSVRGIVFAFLQEVHYFDDQRVKQESGFRLEASRYDTPRKGIPLDERGYRCP